MPRSTLLFLVILYCIHNVNSATILGLFPHPGKSHQMMFDPLLKELAERGHDVTVATFFPLDNKPNNYKEVNLQHLAGLRLESLHAGAFEFPAWYTKIPVIGNVISQYEQHKHLESGLKICEKLVKFQPLAQILKENYDVVITESFNSKCVLGLLDVYEIKAPVIGMSSCSLMPGDARRMGADDNPSFVPAVTSAYTHQMSFLMRLENFFTDIILKQFYNDLFKREQAVIENHFGKKITDINVLANNMSLLMVNSHHVFRGVYPSVPGIIEVGGIHIEPLLKRIPTYIEKFINESEHGVILFSFGSQLGSTSISKSKQDMFIRVFSKLKQRVIWKYADSADEGTKIGPNILRVRWLPQNELLHHPKIKVFISHGGKLGAIEAISAGKPMVLIPIFADQKLNAAALRNAEAGDVLSLPNLTEQDLERTLQKMLGERMHEKARKVSQMWHDRETTPLDTAVFWTERVIRWGNQSPLYSQSKYLSFIQYNLLDVIGFLVVLSIAILALIYIFIVRIFKLSMVSTKVKKDD